MRIAHLADLHLGFRRYYRMTKAGINARENDVAIAFRRTVDDVIAQEPDAVVIAGDIFHSSRPSNLTLIEADRQIARLAEVADLVLLVPGNHDTPRTADSGNILPLFCRIPGVLTAVSDVATYYHRGVRFTLVGTPALLQKKDFGLGTGDWRQVLVIHAGLTGRVGVRSDRVGPDVSPSDVGYDYVAMGDWHVAQKVGPRAWYAGSIEYTSSNPWSELKDETTLHGKPGKGWLLVDLDHGKLDVRFRPIELARQHIDLPALDAEGLTSSEVAAKLGNLTHRLKDNVVRQVVTNVSRDVRRELPATEIVKAYRHTCFHYQLDMRRASHRVHLPPVIDDEPFDWEIEQAREAEYWDGREQAQVIDVELTKENIAQQADGYREIADPYGLD